MNKKTLIIVAVAVVVVLAVVLGVVLLGGNNETPTTTTTTKPTTTTTTTTTTTGNGGNSQPTGEEFTLGMGVNFGTHTDGAEITATVATVVLDANGKIVACRLDVTQNKYTFDIDGETFAFEVYGTDGKPAADGVFMSKMERLDGYGMAAALNWGMDNDGDGRVLEWYEQAKAFENYVIGKTVEEVEAFGISSEPVNGHYITTEADLLAAGCTIQIDEFKAAVAKACRDEFAVAFTAVKEDITLGVKAITSDNGSAFVGEDEVALKLALNVDYAAAAVVDGVIVATLNDAYQPYVSISWDGEVVSANVGKVDADGNDLGLMTKRELKENYAMGGKPWSPDNDGDGRVLEWYVQSAAFSAHVVGMTANEVANMSTELKNDHYMSTDSDLISAGCTIQITGLMAVVAGAANNAR